ncbi:G-protein coupled receptor 54-like [Patiria miniata]|uniref:G-protein coupled receptors family 1 profile domain-containing protein n=1 Tax=Patiria miniata TaxID=46514 RepID=A0A914B963_PATMI|nr:G-protein coupled receptor 54-like [Patiria miniata]
MASVVLSTLPPISNETDPTPPLLVADPSFGQPFQKAIGVFTFVIIAVGLVGNSAVIFIVVRYRDMHTTTNFSFANLALTDILLLIFQALSITLDTFGYGVSVSLNCWPTFYLRHVIGEVTGLTLAMMSYDRWRLVAYPLEAVKHTERRKRVFLFGIVILWAVSFAMYVPVIFYSVKMASLFAFCTIWFPWEYGQKVFQTYTAITMYIVPLIFISVCYLQIWLKLRQKTPGSALASGTSTARSSQRMRRTLRLIMVVIAAFALSWLPSRVLLMWVVWDPNLYGHSPVYLIGSGIANMIIYLNSVVNPFIYPFAGTGFRKHLPAYLRGMLARDQTVSSRTTPKRSGDNAQINAFTAMAPSPCQHTSMESLSVGCQTSPPPPHASK